MSVKFVILGYLSWRPMTGYDIKKIIADSETLPWSASNNQIYKSLVQLHQDEWVEKSVEIQDGSPNRHVYTITETGKGALQTWAKSEIEPFNTSNPFFNQLMWGDGLSSAELNEQLEAYINMVGEKLFFVRVQADERTNMPGRNERELLIWDSIQQNWIARLELELKWARNLQTQLSSIK